MKICKIIEEEPEMCPPSFDDWEPYIWFRRFLKRKLYLKKIVKSLIFNVLVIIIIAVNIVILIVSPFVERLNDIEVEYVFVSLFLF